MAEQVLANDIQNQLLEGRNALRSGDSFAARQHFRKVLEADPNSVDALFGLVEATLLYRERQELLQRVLVIDPQNSRAQQALAEVNARLAAGELLAPRSVAPKAYAVEPATTVAAPALEQAPAPEVALTCYIHPNRETGLRCTNCNRPICAACVRRAPVGQLCPECARARRPTNYQVSALTVGGIGALSFAVGLALCVLLWYIILPLPFIAFIVGFIIGPIIGEGYARVLDRITRAKRGRSLQLAVGIGTGFGLAPLCLLLLLAGAIIPLLVSVIFGALVIGAVVRRLI